MEEMTLSHTLSPSIVYKISVSTLSLKPVAAVGGFRRTDIFTFPANDSLKILFLDSA